MDIPVLVGQHHRNIFHEGMCKLRTLTKALKPNNHEVLSTECLWRDRDIDAKKFYQIIEKRLTINLI